MLALNANRVTSVEQLVDAVWNTAPPDTARAQIQTCVSKLRKLFGSVGCLDVIETYPRGYLLKLTANELDSEEFAELVAVARRQAGEGQLTRAAATLRKALGLWRGLALADVQSWQVGRGSALLEDRRLSAIEERVRIDLALGSHKEIVDELAALVRDYPLRERLYGFLMLALYRSGRQAEALEVRRRVRTVLVEELGIEPGRELQELERAILNRESSLDWRPDDARLSPLVVEPARPVPAAGPLMVPHELPFSIADFTGREELIQRIRDIVVGDTGAPYSVRIVAISGKGGVGKSSLAVRVAHELMGAFPGGHLYGDFLTPQGSSAGALLARFLRAMGVTGSAIPEDIDERARMYRSMVARNRVLVVLDDVTSEDEVLPLLPGSPLCAVLVTSRTRLSGLPGAVWVDVEPFDTNKSIEFLAKIVGPERIAAEEQAVVELVRFCGGLPLALRIAGGRLASRPHWRISKLVGRLDSEARRLDEFAHRGLELRTNIGLTYRTLRPCVQRLFRLFALVHAPDFPGWTAAALLDTPLAEADEVLESLVDARMLDTVEYAGEPIRYRYHGLIRMYALERLLETETAEEREATVTRVLGAWLALAEEAHRKEYGGDYTILHGSAPRWRPPAEGGVTSPDDWWGTERDWWDIERGSLVAAIRQAAAVDGLDELCWDLALTSVTLFESKGYFDLWRETAELGLSVTERAGNRTGHAAMLYSLGTLHVFQKRLGEAEECFAVAMEMFEADGNPHGRGLVQRNVALVDGLRGNSVAMLANYEQALDALRTVGDRMAEAQILRSVAKFWIDEGDTEQGRALLEEALGICKEVRCLRGEAQVVLQVARLYANTGQLKESQESLHRVLRIVREIGDRIGETYALYALGVSRYREGRVDTAEQTLLHALVLARRVGERLVEGETLYVLGKIALARGDTAVSADHLAAAGQLFKASGSVLWLAKTLSVLSDLHTANRDLVLAADYLARAAELLANLDSKEAARWRWRIQSNRTVLSKSLALVDESETG